MWRIVGWEFSLVQSSSQPRGSGTLIMTLFSIPIGKYSILSHRHTSIKVCVCMYICLVWIIQTQTIRFVFRSIFNSVKNNFGTKRKNGCRNSEQHTPHWSNTPLNLPPEKKFTVTTYMENQRAFTTPGVLRFVSFLRSSFS